MTSTRFLLAAMVLGTAIGVEQANAQCSGNGGSCNTTNTASVAVNALVKLGMSGTTTSLTSPTADQVEVGALIADAGPSFTVKANRSWTLNIKTSNATIWTYAGSFAGTKPISDLTWSNAVAGTYANIGTSDAVFLSGAGATNGAAAQAFFKTVWAAGFAQPSNAPGTYSLPVVFTLSAP
ncbi:MAG: hypothetical protein M3P12_09490 [Gemmatimonadota bacterium]|nr:hypothetical protein [Gemmatimonadota bacterium]